MTDEQRQEVEELEGRIAALKRELADVERPGRSGSRSWRGRATRSACSPSGCSST